MRAAPSASPISLFRRFLALSSAIVVLALGIFAASPDWHEQLHQNECDHHGPVETEAGHRCAIVLFANGLALSASAVIAPLPSAAWREISFEAPVQIFLSPPRYLHRPERGPPVS